MSVAGQRSRCLVVYDHLPHYRFGVFSRLESAEDWDFSFAAAERSRNGSIEAIPFGLLSRGIALQNFWLGPFLWQRGLLRTLGESFDCVIFLGSVTNVSTWVGALQCRVLRRPVYFWTIGWHRPERGVKRVIRMAFYRLADHLMLYGTDAARLGAEMGYPPEKMTVIGNSHSSSSSGDYDEMSSKDLAALLPPRGTACVGAVVRLNPEKRLDLLIKAVALLRSGGEELSVLLVGAGPVAPEVRAMADEMGVPLYLTGAVHSKESLKHVYERLTVTVLPERAGLTVMQSMEFGVPVVTVDDPHRQVPEFRAVVPGVTGEMYSPGDVNGLAAALGRALANVRSDPAGVAQACREEVRLRWSPELHAGKIIDVMKRGRVRGIV